ncbi:MAG: Hint domain-containing protein [Candidatus Paceibacterota bacterium]
MKTFKNYLIESRGDKNLHLQHIEDMIFIGGISGIKQSLSFLQSLRDMLSSSPTNKKINLTTKYDGCLSSDTQVITNEGIKTLKEIFESWHSNKEIYILARDEETNQDVYVSILDPKASKSIKDWVKVELENGGNILCTGDHKIKTLNRGWIEAKSLTENDDVEISTTLNRDGIQRLLSEKLNDTTIEKNNK